MTHLSSLLSDLGIPEHAKELIREAVRRDMEPVAWRVTGHRGDFVTLYKEQAYGCGCLDFSKLEKVTPLFAAQEDA